MYQELYNDLLPIEDLKRAFKDYFKANTPDNCWHEIELNVENKLDDSRLAYTLIPTNVQNYEMAKYIKDTTEATDSDFRIIYKLKQLDSIYQAHYSIIEKNPNINFPDVSSISQILTLLEIDSSKLIKGNKLDKSSKEYKTLKRWLKDAPIDPSYSLFTSNNRANSYIQGFANTLEKDTGFHIDNISEPEVRKSIITLLSTRKELNEYKSIFDMEAYLNQIKSLGYISSIPYITFGETLKSIIEKNENLKNFYLSLEKFKITYSSKESYDAVNDIYHQEMMAMLADKLDIDESEETLTYFERDIKERADYFPRNDDVAAYFHPKGLNSQIPAVVLKINENFNTHDLIHEMTHALSFNQFKEAAGYRIDDNSIAFNEIVTDYLATEISRSIDIPENHILSENTSSYRKGILFLSDFLHTFKEEICIDFATFTSCLSFIIGPEAYDAIVKLSKDYLNYNVNILYYLASEILECDINDDEALLSHLDEIQNSPKYKYIKDELENYLQLYERLNDPVIQLPIQYKKLENLTNSNGNQKDIEKIQNEITRLENIQSGQYVE